MSPNCQPASPSKPKAPLDAKKDRLAAALKANLKRRKAVATKK